MYSLGFNTANPFANLASLALNLCLYSGDSCSANVMVASLAPSITSFLITSARLSKPYCLYLSLKTLKASRRSAAAAVVSACVAISSGVCVGAV